MDHVEVWLADPTLGAEARVGHLYRARGRTGEVVRFEYDAAWIDRSNRVAFAIDPEIPLSPGAHFAGPGRTLHGIFRDTAPDRWGRVLMERREAAAARAEGRPVRRMTDWDFLVGVNDPSRMGALRYRDPERDAWLEDHELGAPPATRLRELEAIVRRIDEPGAEQRPEYTAWLRSLVIPGTSLGGARPKASFVDEDGSLWLAKFPANDDRRDVGAWEYVAHRLALEAGLEMPGAKLKHFASPHHTFCVKRFDRVAGARRLYASAMTLLGRNDGDAGSYLEIADAIQRQGDPATIESDLHQLYRRIAFSILIGNRDDHFRNHGFLRGAKGWRLSPAFDINPNPDKHEHALAIDEHVAAPQTEVLRSTAKYYRLATTRAREIEAAVRDAVTDWKRVAANAGVAPTELQQLETVIDVAR